MSRHIVVKNEETAALGQPLVPCGHGASCETQYCSHFTFEMWTSTSDAPHMQAQWRRHDSDGGATVVAVFAPPVAARQVQLDDKRDRVLVEFAMGAPPLEERLRIVVLRARENDTFEVLCVSCLVADRQDKNCTASTSASRAVETKQALTSPSRKRFSRPEAKAGDDSQPPPPSKRARLATEERSIAALKIVREQLETEVARLAALRDGLSHEVRWTHQEIWRLRSEAVGWQRLASLPPEDLREIRLLEGCPVSAVDILRGVDFVDSVLSQD